MIHGDRIFAIKWTDNRASSNIKSALYYTPSEVVDKYHIELRRLYKVAKRLAFKTYSASGRIWYLKEDVDGFFMT